PPGFRGFSNDVLVGNFSFLHSEINAFIPSNGKLHGTIPIDTGGTPPGGLWAIEFGVGGSNGSPDVLYFADGINREMDGLFGAMTAIRVGRRRRATAVCAWCPERILNGSARFVNVDCCRAHRAPLPLSPRRPERSPESR